jgi:ribosomal 30S subunit maturation factor RimM
VEQGAVADVIAGAVDIWVLETDAGEQRFFVATKDAIVSVDLEAGRVIVRDGSVTAGE